MKLKITSTAIFFILFSLFMCYRYAPLSADDDILKWAPVNMPFEGKSGSWVMAKGEGSRYLTRSSDGTLFCYTKTSVTSYTLFKSNDEGKTWSYTGGVKDTIVDIAVAPDNPRIICYATESDVYRSSDAGITFNRIPYRPGNTGTGNIKITTIDISLIGNYYAIAAGITDMDSGEFGGIYLFKEDEPEKGWQDTAAGNWDVFDVAFSPAPVAGLRHLVAVVNNEAITSVITWAENNGWGNVVTSITLPINTLTGADIAFPDDYGSSTTDFNLFVGFDTGTGNGDVYIIYGGLSGNPSTFVDFDIGRYYGISSIDVTSICVTGNVRDAQIFAGTAKDAQIYFSTNGGVDWRRSSKPPTGTGRTYVVRIPGETQRGFCTTSGDESAFSVTLDGGNNWQQASLINTRISNIVTMTPSPRYAIDSTVFLLTFGNSHHSLWISESGGKNWLRVFSSALPNVDSIDIIGLSPQYTEIDRVIYVSGASGGKPVVWKSEDGARSFGSPRVNYDTSSGAVFTIDRMTIIDNKSFLCSAFDGTSGIIYLTTNSGISYDTKGIVGKITLNSIVVSPDYENDHTILAGNTAGWVFLSTDGGNTFETLPLDAISAPLSGNITVAFDVNYASNGLVYAASGVTGKGLYRFNTRKSSRWETMDSTLPTGSIINSLVIGNNGLLYAANAKAGCGMERCLNPRLSSPVFETVSMELENTATLNGLWLSGNRLWSIDQTSLRILTLVDTLSSPPILKEPSARDSGVPLTNIRISWEAVPGATLYEWQVDADEEFTTVPSGFSDSTQATYARLPELEAGTEYSWRIRVTEPVYSPWSARRTFTTILSGEVNAPQLVSPLTGASVSSNPILQWNPVAGAETYEILIARDNTFHDLVVQKQGKEALPTTVWQCDQKLDAGVTYYWKVRGTGSGSSSAWSTPGVFVTAQNKAVEDSQSKIPSETSLIDKEENTNGLTISSAPVTIVTTVSVTQVTPISPPPQTIQIQETSPDWIKWVFYLGGAILFFMICLLFMFLGLIFRVRRE